MLAASKPLKLALYADYNQIHIADSQSKADLGEAWTVGATKDLLAVTESSLGVGTVRRENVAVTVTVVASKAEAPAPLGFDHVTEASVDVASGVVVFAGCTDYFPDAKRIKLQPGCWRVRISHSKMSKGPERLEVHLWPAKRTKSAVIKRWSPAPAKPAAAKSDGSAKPAKPAKTAKQAVHLVRSGQIEQGLPFLKNLADGGDAAASASVAEVLAFQGKWKELVPYATALIANPAAVYAGNVFTEMCHLIRRASAELSEPKIIKAAAKAAPAKRLSEINAVLLKDFFAHPDDKPNPSGFAATVAKQQRDKRFAGHPKEFAQHCFALAANVYNLDDEVIARWNQSPDLFGFEETLIAAVATAKRGRYEKAWNMLAPKVSQWFFVDAAQVAPVILVVHPALIPVMTAERCEQVLRTSRI